MIHKQIQLFVFAICIGHMHIRHNKPSDFKQRHQRAYLSKRQNNDGLLQLVMTVSTSETTASRAGVPEQI